MNQIRSDTQAISLRRHLRVDISSQLSFATGHRMCVLDRLEQTRPGEQNDYFVKEQIALYGTDSFWGLPHHPRVPYYRAGKRAISNASALFQFIVPMFLENWLKPEIVAAYTSELDQGKHPTAVAISLLNVKGPADRGEDGSSVHEHWALTHFLIDGHHKAAAARKRAHHCAC